MRWQQSAKHLPQQLVLIAGGEGATLPAEWKAATRSILAAIIWEWYEDDRVEAREDTE